MNYEINNETIAICPLTKNTSKIIELNDEFIISKSVNSIMENSCEYFGSTLLGRKKGTKNLIGVSHKSPIIVEESKEMIFFPTASSRKAEECTWIRLKYIEKYYKCDNFIKIEFTNNNFLKLNLSYGIIDNQILRATRLESVLRNRKKN